MADMKTDKEQEKVPVLLSKRWAFAFLAMMAYFVTSSLRYSMSVAIVCMVRYTATPATTNDNIVTGNVTNSESKCGELEAHEDTDGEFDWSKSTQSVILSAFFYGYLTTQVVAGWISGRFGGKLVVGCGIFIMSLATLLTPVSARWDYRMVVALRVVMGMSSGMSVPSVTSILSRWAPPRERTRLVSLANTGSRIGDIITSIGAGVLCAEGFDNGWGSVFYVIGGAGLVLCVLWFALVSNSPEEHPGITAAEKNYIVQSIGDNNHKTFKVPWRSVLTSRGLWVMATAHVCSNWTMYTMFAGLPTFMKEVLKFDIKQNGVLSALPYVVNAVIMLTSGHLADFLRSRCLSTTTTRKLFQTTSFVLSGTLIVAAGFVSCEQRGLAVVVLSVAVGSGGLNSAGFMVNHIDFAPRYAGILYGITNSLATIPGVLAPTVIGALTPNKTQEEWRNVFYVCAGFTVLGAVVFGGFAQGEIESWAREDTDVEKDVSPPIEKKKAFENEGFQSEGDHCTKM